MKKITDSVYGTLNISSGLTSNPQAWIVSSKDRGRKKSTIKIPNQIRFI